MRSRSRAPSLRARILVTVHNPIGSDDGDLARALYGSFLPVPDESLFPMAEAAAYDHARQPGALVAVKGTVTLNEGRQRIKLRVTSKGDRPIQVGSHYHFIETNPQLEFDRGKAYGFRLDIAAGTSVRFEPATPRRSRWSRSVATGSSAVAITSRPVPWTPAASTRSCASCRRPASRTSPSPSATTAISTPSRWTAPAYAAMFGPTTGDRVRLGSTDLWIKVEKDLTVFGDECKFGGGKTLREGMGQATGRPDAETLDMVVTNALIVDWTGIYKADIGVKNGMIAGIGKAGNPDVMDGVSPNMVVGSCTDVVAGENKIITAGGIDTHIHFICPQQAYESIASGITTMLGGGTGPRYGLPAYLSPSLLSLCVYLHVLGWI